MSLRHLAPRGDVDLSVPEQTTGSDPSDHVPLPRDDASRSNDTARCDSHVPIESETVRKMFAMGRVDKILRRTLLDLCIWRCHVRNVQFVIGVRQAI